jgi:hypothetical protein
MKKFLLILGLSIVLPICGCNGKPNDVPPLFPCKVIVTKDSAPMEGVNVILGLTSDSSMCSTSGVTNSSGVAEIHTNRIGWQGQGAPAGDYIVTISKEPKYEIELSAEEAKKMTFAEQELHKLEQKRKYETLPREIPRAMSNVTTTPHRLTVSQNGENVLNIDITATKK